MTCRLQEVRPSAPSALAAPMTRVIALMAPVTLGLSGGTSHEPFHAYSRHHPMGVTKRSSQEQLRRYRDLPGSDRTVDQVVALPNRTVLGIKAAPLCGAGSGAPCAVLCVGDARPARPRRPSHSSTTNLGGSIGSPALSAAQDRHPRFDCPARGSRIKAACGTLRVGSAEP